MTERRTCPPLGVNPDHWGRCLGLVCPDRPNYLEDRL